MATDKLWTKQITLFYAGESNPVTIPGLLNSDSSLEVFETTGIVVTVQDAAAGTINFTTPPPSFTNITLIAGQDVDWADGSGTPNITDHPISELEVDIALAGAQTAEANEGRLDNVEATIGDSSAGLVKDVADNAAAIGDNATAIGDATSGLTKAVADNAQAITDNAATDSDQDQLIADNAQGVADNAAANTAQDQAISDNAAAATANAQALADLFDVDGKIKAQYLPQATASGLPADFFTNDGKIKESYLTNDVLNKLNELYVRSGDAFTWSFTVSGFKNKVVDLAPVAAMPSGLPNVVSKIKMKISDTRDHLYFKYGSNSGMAPKDAFVWSRPDSEGVASWNNSFILSSDSGWLPEGSGAGGVPFSYGSFNDGELNEKMKANVQLVLQNSFFIDITFDQHQKGKDSHDTTITVHATRIKTTL